jgi:hypothetical protein
MNKADEIKKLVDRLEDSYYADEGPHINSVVASAELHAAIDAQQAEIERLTRRLEYIQKHCTLQADAIGLIFRADVRVDLNSQKPWNFYATVDAAIAKEPPCN